MIILDTNVISALMKADPEPIVTKWINQYSFEYLWLTAITVMEIEYGIELLSKGKKKETLKNSFHRMLHQKFRGQIIEFDATAAVITGDFLAKNKKEGFNPDIRDFQIAGIVYSKGAYLATRNVKDFKDVNIDIIDPWGGVIYDNND